MTIQSPPSVSVDSTDSRQHRGMLAQAVNTLLARVFKPNAVVTATAAADVTLAALRTTGNPVLITGYADLVGAPLTCRIRRDGVDIALLAIPISGRNTVLVYLDNPPAGSYVYSTYGSGFTTSATLSAVELK